jgi:antirestriction protein ArdC
MKTDLYNKVTGQIVSSLERGVRPWMQPWSAEHAAGRITRPLTQLANTGPEARSSHAMAYDSGEVAIVIRLPKITCVLG